VTTPAVRSHQRSEADKHHRVAMPFTQERDIGGTPSLPTLYMFARTCALLGALALLSGVTACHDATDPFTPNAAQLAKGGMGGGAPAGGTPAPATRCARITVTNNGQTVRHAIMPDIKYNLDNCGSVAIAVTVTVTEVPGFLSAICPSPVALPLRVTLAASKRLSATLPVYRGGCGMTSNVNGTVVQGGNAWQGHNLQLSVTDDSTGNVLSTAFFSWQDAVGQGI
jgi:hypothetical protein